MNDSNQNLKEMVTLETERLTLRMWREDDFEDYARICADVEVMRYLGGKPLNRHEAWRHMAFLTGNCSATVIGLLKRKRAGA